MGTVEIILLTLAGAALLQFACGVLLLEFVWPRLKMELAEELRAETLAAIRLDVATNGRAVLSMTAGQAQYIALMHGGFMVIPDGWPIPPRSSDHG